MLHVTGPQEVSAVTELNTSLGTLGTVGLLGLASSSALDCLGHSKKSLLGVYILVLLILSLIFLTSAGLMAHFKVKSNLSLSLVHKPKRYKMFKLILKKLR